MSKPWIIIILYLMYISNIKTFEEAKNTFPLKGKSLRKLLKEAEKEGLIEFVNEHINYTSKFMKLIEKIKLKLRRRNKVILQYNSKWFVAWIRKKYVKSIIVENKVINLVIKYIRERGSVTVRELNSYLKDKGFTSKPILEILKCEGLVEVINGKVSIKC